MKKDTLQKILLALVDDFGYRDVRRTLEGFSESTTKIKGLRKTSAIGRGKAKTKRGAVAIVEALEIDNEEKKEILLSLAGKFEKKTFMPNINNVRAFLAQQGQDISHIKSRQQTVPTIFKCLADWEANSLNEMHDTGEYSGPKSLSVIAESIEKAGRQNRP